MRLSRKRKVILQNKRLRKKFQRVTSLLLIGALLLSYFPNVKHIFAEGAVDWPNMFLPYKDVGGQIIRDPANDEHPIDIDITSGIEKGIGPLPSVYYAMDQAKENVFFRLRIKGNPYDRKGGFLSSVWNVQLGVSGEKIATVGVNGKGAHTDYVYVANADGTNVHNVYQTDGTGTAVPGTRYVEADNGQYFIDFQVPISQIEAISGKTSLSSTPLQLYFGTSKAANLSVINKDYMNDTDGFGDSGQIQLDTLPAVVDIDGGTRKEYSTASPTMTGTSSAGQVTINIAGQNKTVDVVNSVWNYNLNNVVLGNKNILGLNGTYTATVTAGDAVDVQDVVITQNASEDSISIKGGSQLNINTQTPTISGTSMRKTTTGGSTRVYLNNVLLEDKITSDQWSVVVPPENALIEGQQYTVKAQLYKTTGNTTEIYAEAYQQITYKSEAINPVDVSVGIVGITGDAFPTVTGTSTNASEVEVIFDDTTVAVVKPNSDGSWSVGPFQKPLNIGEHKITAIARHESGSSAVATMSHTVSNQAISIDNDNDQPLTINETQPTIRGKSNAGSGDIITVSIDDRDYTATVSNSGNWYVETDASSALSEGSHTVVTKFGTATAEQTFNIDTSTSITIANPVGEITEILPTIQGTSEENSTIDLRIYTADEAGILHEITTLTTGEGITAWSYPVANELAVNSTYIVKAITTDAFGNQAETTSNFTVKEVTEANTAPDAVSDTVTLDEDSSITIDVLSNDMDFNGDILKINSFTDPAYGIVTQEGDQLVYTPEANYHGTDSFTYTVDDGHGSTDTAAVSVTINPINDAPSGEDITVSTGFNEPKIGVVAASDVDGDRLTFSKVKEPINGAAVINETTGAWTYTPNTDYSGPDSFQVGVSDGAITSNVTITINVSESVNIAPVAIDDSITLDEDTTITIDVLGNDTDLNADIIKINSFTDPVNGVVTQEGDQLLVYTPKANYHGPDSFTYTVSDGHGGFATGTVAMTINSVNDAPITVNTTASTDTNQSVSGKVYASDKDEDDTLSYGIHEGPNGGTATIDKTTGDWTYTPNNGYVGVDTFTVLVKDLYGAEVNATMTIIVNSPPVAVADSFTVDEDSEITISPTELSANDEDPDDDPLAIESYTDGTHGTVTEIDGQVIFKPVENYHGPDSFTYTVSDGHGGFATGTVAVTINSVNDAPITQDNAVSTGANESVSQIASATDVDGDNLTYQVTDPENGTAVIDESGKWTYTPDTGFSGDDNFKITVNDGQETATATIRVTVNMLPLDGWVGERAQGETDSEIIVKPGQPLKLSAVSGIKIDSVKADIGGETVALQLANSETFIKDGVKRWVNVNYRLPDAISSGTHQVVYKAYKGGAEVQIESISLINEDNKFHVISEIDLIGDVTDQSTGYPISSAMITLFDPTGTKKVAETTTDSNGHYTFENIKTNDYLIVIKRKGYGTLTKVFEALPEKSTDNKIELNFSLVKFNLTLSANPSSIVGDGKSATQLKATITDMNGEPISNVDVNFTTQFGTFLGNSKTNTIKTDDKGNAFIILTSEKIEGILAKNFDVVAKVDDHEHALFGETHLLVSFQPASITGIVTNNEDLNKDGSPDLVEGAVVRVTKDFDNDGVIDFSSEYVTGQDGKYSIAIPRGDTTYNVSITITKKIGTENKALTFKQNVQVGTVEGAGNESFDAEKAITGIVVGEGPDGSPTELPDSEQLKAYLIDENGDYVTNQTTGEKGYSLDSDGLFSMEGLSKGNYNLEIKYVFDSGEEITINRMQDGTLPQVSITDNGQMNIAQTLIDPYGTITDPATGEVIVGAKVVLYYADTSRNIRNGIKPNTVVDLPIIEGFAPNNNINPQLSDVFGKYAYMVFPHTDYYLVVTKSGYETYTSPVISVETAIVKHDISMTKIHDSSVPDEKQDDNTGEHKDNTKDQKENSKEVEKQIPATSEVKSQLPYTATNIYNWLYAGLVLFGCGVVLLILQRRRNKIIQK